MTASGRGEEAADGGLGCWSENAYGWAGVGWAVLLQLIDVVAVFCSRSALLLLYCCSSSALLLFSALLLLFCCCSAARWSALVCSFSVLLLLPISSAKELIDSDPT